MAQKLVSLLSPLVSEITPLLGQQSQNISYGYTFENDITSCVELKTFTISMNSNMKPRMWEALKLRIVKHKFKNVCVESMQVFPHKVILNINYHYKFRVFDEVFEQASVQKPY